MKYFTYLLLFSLFPTLLAAQQAVPGPHHCSAMPALKVEGYPGKDRIVASSRLVRAAGSADKAEGQELILSGRVYNKHCVPVSNAIVEIWQRSPEGKLIYTKNTLPPASAPKFSSSGRTTTDNLGKFEFITLFPGSVKDVAPHISFRITHESMKRPFMTAMYFRGDQRNSEDPKLIKLYPEYRELILSDVTMLTGNKLGVHFDVTLPTSGQSWKSF